MKGRKIEVTPKQREIIRDGIDSLNHAIKYAGRKWNDECQEAIDDLLAQVGEN